MSYSSDFRELVVNKIHEGMPRSQASKFFNISRDSIYKWLKKHAETGSLANKERKQHKPKKIDPQRLLERIEASPDATLEELAQEFGCWPQSIQKRCINLGITRKKNHAIRRKK